MKPDLSVVIPTCNRKDRLTKALESLVGQSLRSDLFEIIVVDDGSQDGTKEMIEDFSQQIGYCIRYCRQENMGAGAARNLGIMEAKAPIVLLMDDDMIPNKDHLELHLGLHWKYPESEVAVRGRIIAGSNGVDLLRWEDSEISVVDNAGDGEPIIGTGYFVTGDVSLKKDFVVKAGLFTPGLRLAEDTDLALRLENLGLKLIYCREACAVHTEPLDTLEKVVDEGKKYGRAFAQWQGRIPLYTIEIWRLGGRLNGGWDHFRRYPWGYLKDALRRWTINPYTIRPILWVASKVLITNPPRKLLRRFCKEIYAYYYRHEFRLEGTEIIKRDKRL